jgi:hypothetical protein
MSCSLPYNVKILTFQNGLVEIRRYTDGINMDIDSLLVADGYIDEKKPKSPDKEYNPFTDKMEHLPSFVEAENNQIRSARVSLSRTKNSIYNYSRQVKWEYFITLTFDSVTVDRFDYKACVQKLKFWLNNQKKRYAPELYYLCVPEMHENGAWHIHGLLAQVSKMVFEDSGRVSVGGKAVRKEKVKGDYQTIYNLSGWKFGWSTATKVRDTDKVSNYITKYITKELCEHLKGSNRYFRSRNIPEPEESHFIVEPKDFNDFVQMYMDSVGADFSYQKSISGYTTVDYIYCKVKESEKDEQRDKKI